MSAIKLYTSKTDAFYFKDSQRNSFYEFGGIQLLPYYYYLQPYTYSDTITKVESFRLRDDVLLNDLSLYIQATVGYGIKFSQTNVMPYDYGNELIYLRFTYSGGYFYSNPFYYTTLDEDKTTYMAYRDNFVDAPYRISLKVWFRQKSRQSELITYYETKTKNTVTQAIKSHDLDMYESEFMSMEDLIMTTDILESPCLIINNLSSSLFEAVKLPELTQQENFGKIKFILNYDKSTIVPDELEPIKEIIIGTQTWTNSNLNVETYRDGTEIPQVTDPTAWANLTTGAWCYYNNDSATGTTYGKLYNWYAVNDPRGLAPTGYHIPSDAEWTTLTTYLGGESIAGGKMKATGISLWNTPNTDATNSSGFTGLPGGYRTSNGPFYGIGYSGTWWSSSESITTTAWFRYLDYNYGYAGRYYNNKRFGLSVRLIKD